MPTVIALTGGIASGKSRISRYLAEQGYPVFSADEAARAVVEPGQPAWEALRQAFGPEYFHPDGTLDRARLRQQVFADTAARKQLEALTHPAIHRWLKTRIEASEAPLTFVEIPLLVESGRPPFVDQVWVVDCPVPVQKARAQARGLDEKTVEAILAAQASREARLQAADAVINTDCHWPQTQAQVDELLQRLKPD